MPFERLPVFAAQTDPTWTLRGLYVTLPGGVRLSRAFVVAFARLSCGTCGLLGKAKKAWKWKFTVVRNTQ